MDLVDNSALRHVEPLRDRGELADEASLDPNAGGAYRDKPIWNLDQIDANLNRTGYDWYHNNYGELDDGVLNYGFWLNYEELANSYYVNATGSNAFNEAYYKDAFSPFTDAQKGLARETIALWDDLVGISFRETRSGAADITYANTDTGGAQAYAYLPFGDIYDDFYAQFDFEDTGRLSGDVWIDGFVQSNFNPVADSYYAKLTMIHETGHALGLSHPGDYDALDDNDGDGVPDPITYASDAAFAQDSLQYSVMSYFDAYETGAQHIDWSLLNFAYSATPLVHDISAIQAIYGADTTTRTGDTVYGFNSTAERVEYDFTQNTRPIVSIWDAGGNDTIDFSGWDTPSTINLNEGAFSSGGGIEDFLTLDQVNANRAALGFAPRTQAQWDFYQSIKDTYDVKSPLFSDNISIAYGAVIENAIGGGGSDTIIANQVANRIDGGGGLDVVSYETATSGVYVSMLQANVVTRSGASNDVLLNIEGVTGSAFADTLTGSKGTNRLAGGLGNDTLKGEAGNDFLNGGGGDDVMSGDAGRDTFFFDTKAGTNLGSDTVKTFGPGDRIVTTSKIFDSNNDGLIKVNASDQFFLPGAGGEASSNAGSFKVFAENGKAVSTLKLIETQTDDDQTYFVYSNIHDSTAGSGIYF
jgi:serralysin